MCGGLILEAMAEHLDGLAGEPFAVRPVELAGGLAGALDGDADLLAIEGD